MIWFKNLKKPSSNSHSKNLQKNLKCQNLDQMSSQKIITSQHWDKPQALISGVRIASLCLIRLVPDMQLIKSREAKTHFSGQKLKPCISTYDFLTYMPKNGFYCYYIKPCTLFNVDQLIVSLLTQGWKALGLSVWHFNHLEMM